MLSGTSSRPQNDNGETLGPCTDPNMHCCLEEARLNEGRRGRDHGPKGSPGLCPKIELQDEGLARRA